MLKSQECDHVSSTPYNYHIVCAPSSHNGPDGDFTCWTSPQAPNTPPLASKDFLGLQRRDNNHLVTHHGHTPTNSCRAGGSIILRWELVSNLVSDGQEGSSSATGSPNVTWTAVLTATYKSNNSSTSIEGKIDHFNLHDVEFDKVETAIKPTDWWRISQLANSFDSETCLQLNRFKFTNLLLQAKVQQLIQLHHTPTAWLIFSWSIRHSTGLRSVGQLADFADRYLLGGEVEGDLWEFEMVKPGGSAIANAQTPTLSRFNWQ